MSESNHDTDISKTDVAIAAESHLDREGAGSGDGPDGSVTMILGALEKMAMATDQLTQQMNERLEDVERDLENNRQQGDPSGDLEKFREEMIQAVQSVREVWTGREEDLASRFGQLRDEVESSSKDQRGWFEDEFRAVRETVASLREAVEEAFAAADRDRAGRLEETLQGQRTMVADLAEGIALVQTSMEHRLAEIEEKARQAREKEEERWEAFVRDQQARLDAMTAQTREVHELGQRLEHEHAEMVRVFEQEKERARKEAEERQREQARRINNSGVARYHAGDYAQARVLFEQAVQADQHFAEAFNNLGLALTELGEHEDATVAFETAIELNPELGAGYNNLGYVLYLQQNFEAAIEMYNEAIGREHDTSAAYTNLGNAWQKLDQTDKAVEAWRRALEVDPSNERARRYLDRFAGPTA